MKSPGASPYFPLILECPATPLILLARHHLPAKYIRRKLEGVRRKAQFEGSFGELEGGNLRRAREAGIERNPRHSGKPLGVRRSELRAGCGWEFLGIAESNRIVSRVEERGCVASLPDLLWIALACPALWLEGADIQKDACPNEKPAGRA